MNESEAKFALRELGITPNAKLIEAWIRAEEGERRLQTEEREQLGRPEYVQIHIADNSRNEPQPPRPRSDGLPNGSSESNLESSLREQGVLERRIRVGRPGRPRIIASWMPAVADMMKTGAYSLPAALRLCDIHLNAKQLRALYRNVAFKEMRQEARRNYLFEIWSRRQRVAA